MSRENSQQAFANQLLREASDMHQTWLEPLQFYSDARDALLKAIQD